MAELGTRGTHRKGAGRKLSAYGCARRISTRRRKGCVVKKPAGTVTLSSAEGEALIAQVRQSNVPPAEAGMGERIIRRYFWVVFALQEATLSVQRLRRLLFGKGPKPEQPPAPEASSTLGDAVGKDDGGGAL